MGKGKFCYNGGMRHNFSPRYSEVLVRSKNYEDYDEYYHNLDHNIDSIINRIYVYDICIWCGKIIERKEENK